MKNILQNKLKSVQEKMNAMHNGHLYYLSSKWKELKAQENLLEELIAEAPEEAPEGFSIGVKAMLDELAATRNVKVHEEPVMNVVEAFALEELKEEMLERYCNDVTAPEFQEAFKASLETAELEDTRASGWRCSYCKRYSIASVAFGQQDVVLYADITGNKKIILCNKHYCGCLGWE